MKRVPPSQRTKQEIDKLVQEGTSEAEDPKTALVRLGVKRVIEEALEAAVRDLLGREYYQRREGEGSGYRNGYRKGRLKTSEGEVSYEVPQVREVDARALTQLRSQLGGRTEGLETLALEMFARGCSTRDIEEIFRTEQGGSLLSRTAVSEITEALWQEYEEFATRDLSDVAPLYLFLDGIAERLRPGAKSEAILCAWAISWSGQKVLIHLAPGTKESTDVCRDFLEDLRRRGLGDPILVVTDGAPGLIRAVEECFPSSLRQRCLAHKMRNLLSKVPGLVQEEFKQAVQAVYHAPSPALALALREDVVNRFERAIPRRYAALRRTLTPASPICAAPHLTDGRSAPPTCWNGSSSKSAAGPAPPAPCLGNDLSSNSCLLLSCAARSTGKASNSSPLLATSSTNSPSNSDNGTDRLTRLPSQPKPTQPPTAFTARFGLDRNV